MCTFCIVLIEIARHRTFFNDFASNIELIGRNKKSNAHISYTLFYQAQDMFSPILRKANFNFTNLGAAKCFYIPYILAVIGAFFDVF